MSEYLVDEAIKQALTNQKAAKMLREAEEKIPPKKSRILRLLRPDAFTKRAGEGQAIDILERTIDAVKRA